MPGTNRRNSGLFLFREKTSQAWATAQKPVTGRILPGFDWSISLADPAFLQGWTPYRDLSIINPKSGQPEWTRFFINVEVFDHVGIDENDTFMANVSKSALLGADGLTDFDTRDAFTDIRKTINKHIKSALPTEKAALERLIKTENKNESPIAPNGKSRGMLNTWFVNSDNQWDVGPFALTYSALQHLLDNLDEFVNPQEGSRDPQWSNYLLGDVTAPHNGLQFTTAMISAKPPARPFNGIQFNARPKTIVGLNTLPCDASLLARRLVLHHPDLYNFLTYQQQIEYAVEKTKIPYHLIEEACYNWGTVPPSTRRAGATSYSSPTGGPPPPPPVMQPQHSQPTGYGGVSAATFSGVAAAFPPPGWEPHPTAAGYFYLGQECLPEADLRARFAPMPAAIPSPPAIPTPPQMSVPAAVPIPAPPQMAAPAAVPIPAPPIPAPPIPMPPQVATPVPSPVVAPTFPPPGWAAHPTSAGYFYQGQECLTEADLRARFAPVVAAPVPAPAVPVPAAPIPAAAPPAVAAPVVMFWVNGPAQNGAPVQMTQRDLQEIVDAGTQNVVVMSADQSSGWKTPADFGITPDAIPGIPAAAVPAPAAPAAPAAVVTPPTASAGGSGPHTAEEAARYAAYHSKVTDQGQALTDAEMSDFVALMDRAQG